MRAASYHRNLAIALLGVLCWIAIGMPAAQAAQAPVVKAADTSALEDDYYAHSMYRNQIAQRLGQLWHSEKLLRAQYESTGRSDEIRSLNQLGRELLSVRVEIDTLRLELSQENQIIQNIGQSLPD